MASQIFVLFAIFVSCRHVNEVLGHGMVLDPVARGSRWRYNDSAPRNYNDAEQYCGGMAIQWNQNDGKCGICGDNFADEPPRKHEIGGEFGEPVIVEKYKKGAILPAKVRVTANHKGKFWFELCNMDLAKEETESCFSTKLRTTQGEEFWQLSSNESRVFDVDLRVPEEMTCQHCIFRWTWMTGNNWGDCGNGTSNVGCGNQETFRTCSDIAIF
ncbi:uncharacterized protein LOC134827969 [Culicoides brevitarsis]|uniref:uncharacterized protein LOC134827969 n=1 Tax=Culicoides brevitarsis TaxID=469753 RepID=UPI00307B8B07